MNLFFRKKKKTTVASTLGFRIKQRITTSLGKVEQETYVTDQYAFMETAGRKLIFIPYKNALLGIDEEKKCLQPLNLEQQNQQINNLKTIIGEINIEEKRNRYNFNNAKEASIQLQGYWITEELEDLDKTVWYQYKNWEKASTLINLPLTSTQIVKSLCLQMDINGKQEQTDVELLEHEPLTEPGFFDDYLGYDMK